MVQGGGEPVLCEARDRGWILHLCLNRLYYSAFYAVSAALLDRQATFRKHSGVRASFHREFIKTGLLDERWGKLYDRLFEDRQEGDYVAMVSFDEDYVRRHSASCAELLTLIRPLIARTSTLSSNGKPSSVG